MGVDPGTFGANIYLLIGLLVALGVLIVLIIVTWTAVNIWRSNQAKRREDERQRAERYRPDGTPYPPSSRGMCDACGKYCDKVYHTAEHGRLCPVHYEKLQRQQSAT